MNSADPQKTKLRRRLLEWYRKNRILYPWRRTNDPYRIWLSEILLQQTRIPVVLRYYDRILRQFSTIEDLARADENAFLSVWSGIGYYSRAGNMLRCARDVVSLYGGKFPRNLPALLSLPGIGPYTAGALRNLCFHELTPAIDGNISRVLARIANDSHRIDSKIFRDDIKRMFLELGDGMPAGEFFQSLMELGERVCLPKPDCPRCPVRFACLAHRNGTVPQIPRRPQKRKEQTYHWYLLLIRKGNAYCFVQNNKREFLKESWIFPDVLRKRKLSKQEITAAFKKSWGFNLKDLQICCTLRHTVTFRRLYVHVLETRLSRIPGIAGNWLQECDLPAYHTSSITYKVLQNL